jgi:hypothetical protein
MVAIKGVNYRTVEEIAGEMASAEGVQMPTVRKTIYKAIKSGWVEVARWDGMYLLDAAAEQRIKDIRAAGRGYDEPIQNERIIEIGPETLLTLQQASTLADVDERRITRLAKENKIQHARIDKYLGIFPDQISIIKSTPRKRALRQAATGRRIDFTQKKHLTPLQIAVITMRESEPIPTWDEVGKEMRERGLSRSRQRQTFEEAYRKGVTKRDALRASGVDERTIMGGKKP